MANYVLSNSWSHANIRDSVWYAQTEADKTALAEAESIAFGDKVYVIATRCAYIMGADGSWYEL